MSAKCHLGQGSNYCIRDDSRQCPNVNSTSSNPVVIQGMSAGTFPSFIRLLSAVQIACPSLSAQWTHLLVRDLLPSS